MNQSQPKNQKADIRTEVPGPGSRALRAREDAHVAPGLQGYAVMAGIVVDGRAGQRRHRRRRQQLSRLHRRHQRQRARAFAPDLRARGAGAGRRHLGRVVHVARARRARRAPRGRAAGAGRAPAAALFGRRGGGGERAAPRQVPHRQIRVRQLLGRVPRQDHGRAVADGVDVQGQARADGAGRPPDPVRGLLPLPGRPAVPELRHRLRRDRAQAGQDGGGGRGRGGDRRADAGDGGERDSAQGVPARGALPRGRGRRAADHRRDDHRARAHRKALGDGSHGRAARRRHHRQGVRGRLSAVGPADHRRDLGGEAVGQPVRIVVELRRQPAGRGGGRGRAAHHRRGEAGRQRARRRRGAQARAAGAGRSLPVRRSGRRRRPADPHGAGGGQEDEAAAAAAGDRTDLHRGGAARAC